MREIRMSPDGRVFADGVETTLAEALAAAPTRPTRTTLHPKTLEPVEVWDPNSVRELAYNYHLYTQVKSDEARATLAELCRAAFLRLRPARTGQVGILIDYVAQPLSFSVVGGFSIREAG